MGDLKLKELSKKTINREAHYNSVSRIKMIINSENNIVKQEKQAKKIEIHIEIHRVFQELTGEKALTNC